MARRLRSGYTTGACAAAAAKAALATLLDGRPPEHVDIVFPDGSIHRFVPCRAMLVPAGAMASVVKDAGDDPDVTNGAEICATVSLDDDAGAAGAPIVVDNVHLFAGEGVGRVTKPGLAAAVGEPAINPVPRRMIALAVRQLEASRRVVVTISIPTGMALAEKTLNARLGIVGGLSILGTTGIVRPVSAEAWTATIEASMNVAHEAGLDQIVLSTGRTSEKGAQSLLSLPPEAYAMMGDYLAYSLRKAGDKGFGTVHLAGMWAKIVKAALQVPQTHVRNGALEIRQAADLLQDCGIEGELLDRLRHANTARHMLDLLNVAGRDDVVREVCRRARSYAESLSGTRVHVYVIDAGAQVVVHV